MCLSLCVKGVHVCEAVHMCDSVFLSLYRSIHMCMLTCVSVHTYVCLSVCRVVCVCVCTCEPVHAEPGADFGSLPRSRSTLLIRDRELASVASPARPIVPGLQLRVLKC